MHHIIPLIDDVLPRHVHFHRRQNVCAACMLVEFLNTCRVKSDIYSQTVEFTGA